MEGKGPSEVKTLSGIIWNFVLGGENFCDLLVMMCASHIDALFTKILQEYISVCILGAMLV